MQSFLSVLGIIFIVLVLLGLGLLELVLRYWDIIMDAIIESLKEVYEEDPESRVCLDVIMDYIKSGSD